MILKLAQRYFQKKNYIQWIVIHIILCTFFPLYAHATNLFIGYNPTGAIGYIHIKKLPFNQIYTVIDIKNLNCGGHIKGYTEQQGYRFIIRTDIPDPRKDSAHQCQVTFIRNEQHLTVIEEENCAEWYEMGCSFISMDFFPAPKTSSIVSTKIKPVHQKN